MSTVADIAPRADPDWTSCALTAIAALARTGQQFTASDVADLMGREPEHSSYWGSALAAEACGLSLATLKRAIDRGDLRESYPHINGKPIARGIITHDELTRWIGGKR